ncbi:MAG: hypothetical protein CMP48_20770 [Rickettsiales bacterium]|nr:hypothetical protein [Rickettsiales bacterium]
MKNNRRSFLTKAAALGLASTIPFQIKSRPKAKELPSLKGRKVLFTYGGWDGHEPLKYRDYMGDWLKNEGAEVTLSDSLDSYLDKELMTSVDLIIQLYTMSQITNEQEKGLVEAVKAGVGIAGWHGGLCDAFRNNVEYQFMTGGQWVAHPGGVIDYSVKILDTGDEVTAGLSDFRMTSEQYYMHVDPNTKVLATTKFTGETNDWINGCVIPVAWKKIYGKGRVFYTSLGHNLDHITQEPDALEMLQRGIKWAGASKFEKTENLVNPIYSS